MLHWLVPLQHCDKGANINTVDQTISAPQNRPEETPELRIEDNNPCRFILLMENKNQRISRYLAMKTSNRRETLRLEWTATSKPRSGVELPPCALLK